MNIEYGEFSFLFLMRANRLGLCSRILENVLYIFPLSILTYLYHFVHIYVYISRTRLNYIYRLICNFLFRFVLPIIPIEIIWEFCFVNIDSEIWKAVFLYPRIRRTCIYAHELLHTRSFTRINVFEHTNTRVLIIARNKLGINARVHVYFQNTRNRVLYF